MTQPTTGRFQESSTKTEPVLVDLGVALAGDLEDTAVGDARVVHDRGSRGVVRAEREHGGKVLVRCSDDG